ncbi:carboxymuconolactone decarboxylase family protein [Halorubrum sp. DTA98]|uniref:carboxymuconolactone decarboxylase family protein n=1 Tax=Halorubrum sp. DTA98 TaxID=3402163 RepID=UPI003AAAE8E7
MTGPGSTRIPYITDRDDVPEGHRHRYDAIEESRGGVRGPFGVLMNSPEVAGRIGHLGAYLRYESVLPDAERELTIINTAREWDCAYEWAAHEPIARKAGVRSEAIEAVATRASADGLTETERVIVLYGRELLRDNRTTKATYESAKNQFGVQGVMELTAMVGYYSMLACVLNAFEVTPGNDAPELP